MAIRLTYWVNTNRVINILRFIIIPLSHSLVVPLCRRVGIEYSVHWLSIVIIVNSRIHISNHQQHRSIKKSHICAFSIHTRTCYLHVCICIFFGSNCDAYVVLFIIREYSNAVFPSHIRVCTECMLALQRHTHISRVSDGLLTSFAPNETTWQKKVHQMN